VDSALTSNMCRLGRQRLFLQPRSIKPSQPLTLRLTFRELRPRELSLVHEFLSVVALSDTSALAWHPSQQMRTLSNGRLRLSLRVPSIAQLVSWILEWGPHARVLAPATLVANVRRELEAARLRYGEFA